MVGDMNSGSDARYMYFYEAIDAEDEGRPTDYRVVSKVALNNQQLLDEWYLEVERNNERNQSTSKL